METEIRTYKKRTYEIRLGDLFWYILSGWRFLLGIMLSGGIVLGAYMYWYKASNGIGEGFGDYLSGGYIVIGSLLGFVLGFVIRAFKYLLSGILQTPFAIGDRYTVRTVFFKASDKKLNSADALFLRYRYKGIKLFDEAELMELLLLEAEILKKNDEPVKLLVTGTEPGNSFIGETASMLSARAFDIVKGYGLADNPELIKETADLAGAVIIENTGTSEIQKIDRELEYLALREIPVIAVAVSV